MYRKLKIFHDVFSKSEIDKLISYYEQKPITFEKYLDDNKTLKFRNKDSDYNIDSSIPSQIIRPKLDEIIGEHKLQNGAYLDSHYPFGVHIDNNETWNKEGVGNPLHEYSTDASVIIPLSENAAFKTVFFEMWGGDVNNFNYNKDDKVYNHSDEYIGHLSQELKEKAKRIPIDDVFHWKIGDIAVWGRDQWHCAGDFTSSGLTKQAITLFF